MNTNLNQLLKDLEIGPAYVKILICLLGCTFMLYPTFFHFTCFFRELPVYEQVLFTSGSSALYTGVGILLSAISPVKYPRILYTPLAMLSSSVMISLFICLFFLNVSVLNRVYDHYMLQPFQAILNRSVGNVSAAVHCGWHFHTQGKERRERQCTLLTPL